MLFGKTKKGQAYRKTKSSGTKRSGSIRSSGHKLKKVKLIPSGRVNSKSYVNFIIAYESGEIGTQDTIDLFSYLIKNGMAWGLQGSYGRTASAFIDNRILAKNGTIIKNAGDLAREEEQEKAIEVI